MKKTDVNCIGIGRHLFRSENSVSEFIGAFTKEDATGGGGSRLAFMKSHPILNCTRDLCSHGAYYCTLSLQAHM